jgi:ABC-type dipeptide/oligopeptide/nickel transport system permease component
MLAVIVRRSFGAAATFLAATFVVFMITFALPGDPARAIAGRRQVSESTLSAIRERYHLDDPLPVQYVEWLRGLLRGDLGESFVLRRPVSDVMLDALPVTLTLLALTIAIEVVFGLLIGASAASRRGRPFDNGALVACTLAIAMPVFVLGSIAQDVLGVRVGILPVAGTSAGLQSYLLPAMVLAVPGLAVATRLVRAESLTQLDSAHVRTAHAKGLRRSAVTRRHVVRNASVPFVAFIGLEIGALAAGSIVVERIFNLPGVGRAVADAIRQRDNAVIIGFTMASIAVYLVVDVVCEIVTLRLDPRIGTSA